VTLGDGMGRDKRQGKVNACKQTNTSEVSGLVPGTIFMTRYLSSCRIIRASSGSSEISGHLVLLSRRARTLERVSLNCCSPVGSVAHGAWFAHGGFARLEGNFHHLKGEEGREGKGTCRHTGIAEKRSQR